MDYLESLTCLECEASYSPMTPLTLCPKCGGHLEATYDYERLRRELDVDRVLTRPATIWRWREFLPLADPAHIVSLGEGGTPLQECRRLAQRLNVRRLLVKNEALNPTSSFKDRSFSVAMSKAVEIGVRKGFTRSSGNAGASFAAYAAAAGFDALVLVNAWATDEKLAMIQAYGQRLLKVDYTDSSQLRRLLDDIGQELGLYEFTNFVNPFRHEGLKTYAYEVALDMGWDVPDRMVFPTGSGGGISGSWKGFNELKRMGLVRRLPKMTAVQPEACAPVAVAFQHGDQVAKPHGTLGVTIAQSMASNAPIGGGKRPLRAVYDSGGSAETVSDAEILDGMRLLGQEGIFVEPASAAPIAIVKRMVEEGRIDRDEVVVCVATASGLKQPDAVKLMYGPAETVTIGDLADRLRAYASARR